MSYRQKREKFEREYLSKYAALSENTKGRVIEEKKCNIRTDYQRDRDRIIHSKAFRRLEHKTQVFISPEGDHYRTRLTHTLEVSQISRTIARALGLNEDLTEAIALGHDLGHTPFGHSGEYELNKIHKPDGFSHNEQSLRVVEYLEITNKPFKGLNLTIEVKDGILNHNGPIVPITLEGQIVKISDRIAYINHDIDDALRANVLKPEDLPKEIIEVLGDTHSKRIDLMINDVIKYSYDRNSISMSKEILECTNKLRSFMFDKVYLNINAKSEEGRARHIVSALYYHFQQHPDEMSKERYEDYMNGSKDNAVRDYIAGMTDRYAINKYLAIFVPKFWK
ncbi:MAG: deoxyguanosinetriphosphate triphosphohydrolase [Clostridiales bacterium]|nr:deoxyguanosinetriphosphate triphosphohydrolase [Clostridiales bacterium]